MIVKITESKKEFSIEVNVDNILKEIENLKLEFETDSFVNYGEIPEYDDIDCLSKDKYLENIENFKKTFLEKMNEDFLIEIMKNWNRKKNGTFHRRNVKELVSCNNCIFITEWHNTWIYHVIKVVAVDDYNLKIELCKKTDTPA